MKKRVYTLLVFLLTLTSCSINSNNKTSVKETIIEESKTTSDKTTNITNTKTSSTSIETKTNTTHIKETTTTEVKESIFDSVISYTETKELVKNPASGFYRPHPFKLTETGIEDNITWHNDDGFYHLRISLENYTSLMGGKDIDITKDALDALDLKLKTFNDQGATLIVRFAYDGFKGLGNVEPSMELMKSHIDALGPIVSKYDCVEALECGLVGPWGEMHTSKISGKETFNTLLGEWLKSTTRVPILARRPRFIYWYMGYTIDNLDTFEYKNEDDKRLGVFNDGYLGTDSDADTYLDREKEVAWMEKFLTTPYGGEVITDPDTGKASELTYIPSSIHEEQYKTHLSYLNFEWDNTIVERWQGTTISDNISGYSGYNLYNFMNNHMGYGFLLRYFDVYQLNDKNYLEVMLDTVGYKKNLNNFEIEIVFDNGNNEKIIKINDLNMFDNPILIDGLNVNSKIYMIIKDSLGRKYQLLNDDCEYKKGYNYIGNTIGIN